VRHLPPAGEGNEWPRHPVFSLPATPQWAKVKNSKVIAATDPTEIQNLLNLRCIIWKREIKNMVDALERPSPRVNQLL